MEIYSTRFCVAKSVTGTFFVTFKETIDQKQNNGLNKCRLRVYVYSTGIGFCKIYSEIGEQSFRGRGIKNVSPDNKIGNISNTRRTFSLAASVSIHCPAIRTRLAECRSGNDVDTYEIRTRLYRRDSLYAVTYGTRRLRYINARR